MHPVKKGRVNRMKQITISEITNSKLQEVNDNLLDIIQEGDAKLDIYQGMSPETKFITIRLLDGIEKCAVSMTEDDTLIEITTLNFIFLVMLEPEDFVSIDMR